MSARSRISILLEFEKEDDDEDFTIEKFRSFSKSRPVSAKSRSRGALSTAILTGSRANSSHFAKGKGLRSRVEREDNDVEDDEDEGEGLPPISVAPPPAVLGVGIGEAANNSPIAPSDGRERSAPIPMRRWLRSLLLGNEEREHSKCCDQARERNSGKEK